MLENEFLPINENVIRRQFIGQIEAFGQALVSLGERYSLSMISDYGMKICNYVNNLEIDKMMRALKAFPELIEKIKAINKADN